MLKNKFSMLRILLIALSAIMVVSLAACGSDDSGDDMNKALSEALASQQAQLDAQKDAQAAAEASAKAAEESMKQALADQESKALEESKRAADESKKIEESIKAVQSSIAAAEQSRKDAEESSRLQAAADSKAQSESLSKYLDDLTRTEPTSATEPIVTPDKEDICAVIAEYTTLKLDYVTYNAAQYVGNNYAELVLLFDKAGVDLNNATTVAAAQDILAQLKVDAAAVESVQSVADELQALIEALGDIESEFITTSAAKLDAVDEAWENMLQTYNKYLEASYDKEYEVYEEGEDSRAIAEDLGVNMADYSKATKKLAVLTKYVEDSLQKDLQTIWDKGYALAFNEYLLDASLTKTIADAYYKYQVLTVVNGGDVSAADLPVAWENALNEDGSIKLDPNYQPVPDKDKPIDYFTTEEFMDVYAIIYMEKELRVASNNASNWLRTALGINDSNVAAADNVVYNKLVSDLGVNATDSDITLAPAGQIFASFNSVASAYLTEVNSITFKNNYKTTVTLDEAKKDVWVMAVEAYVDALASVTSLSKSYSINAYENKIEITINDYNSDIDKIENGTVTGTASDISVIKGNISKAEKALTEYKKNVESAPVYTYATLDAESKRIVKDEDGKIVEAESLLKSIATYIDVENKTVGIDAMTYIYDAVVASISEYFTAELASVGSELDYIVSMMVAELKAIKTNFCSENGAEYQKLLGAPIAYLENAHANDAKIAALATAIDEHITALKAVTAEDLEDEEVTIKWKDDKTQGDSFKNALLYFQSEAAKNYVLANFTEADFANGSQKLSNYFTTTANDLPYTYTYTADEKACIAAQDLYTAALQDIFAKVVDMIANDDDALKASSAKKQITDNAEYKAILSNVGGNATLKGEVEALANTYLNAIDNASYWVAFKATNTKDSNVSKYASKSDTITASETGHVTIKADLGHADAFSSENIETFYQNQVNTFMTTGGDDADGKLYNDVVTLYTYRTAKIAELTALINSYKNTYTLVTDTDSEYKGMYIFVPNVAGVYAYDSADKTDANGTMYVTSKDADAVAYEAKLDELLAAAVAQINKVKLNMGKTTITDGMSTKVWNDKTPGLSLSSAMTLVDTIANALVGTTAGTTGTGDAYEKIDSRIFAQYNTLILKNYTGYTKN